MVEHRIVPLDWLFVALSVVGNAGLLWIALALVLALPAGKSPLATAAIVAATVWTADILAALLKSAAGRERPATAVPEADPLLSISVSGSMPSGHAATSFAGAVVLVFLLGRGFWPLLVLAAAVAFSRVYVGAHYPLDVIAGAALGAAVGGAAIALVRILRRTSGAPPRSGAAPPAG